MAVLLTPPELQFFDDDGKPLSGGFVYSYLAGTTTPKVTYTDSTGNTENTNPVELDAAGRAPIWLEGSYKIIVKDSNYATISTTDNITAFSAQETNTEGFFQSFSGNGSTAAFTLSEDLGTDERALMVFVDKGSQEHSTNGTFATDTGWTKGTGWTIGSSVATATGAISTAIEQTAGVTLRQGQSYNVTMTITRSAGTLTPSIGGTAGTARSSNGTYAETIIAGSSQVIAFTGAGFTGTLDTVTVTPVNSAGFDIQAPSLYTVNGTALTFSTAPPTGTNNIYVYAPYTLIGAAGSAQTAADEASASAAAALVSEDNAAASEANAAASEAAVTAAIDTIANMNVDLFTGDGADTTFVLSGTPGNENNVWLSVNGAVISTGNYSLSGNTITFAVAPAMSAAIVARWGFPIGANVADGSVTTIKIADENVTAAKVGSGAATDGQVLTADGSGGAAWETPSSSTISAGYATGRYYLCDNVTNNILSEFVSATQLRATPISITSTETFNRVGIVVRAAVGGSTIRLGLYNVSGGVPTTLVSDFGTVDSATTGEKEITISQALQPGFYALAYYASSALVQVAVRRTDGDGVYANNGLKIMGIANGDEGFLPISWQGTQAFGALPANFPTPITYSTDGGARNNGAWFRKV